MLTRLTRLFRSARRQRGTPARHHRLHLECLEERTLLNNRFVVPLAVAADNVNSFHTLSTALTTVGVVAGDIIQIQLGSSPGNITDANLDAALAATGGNLTVQGELAAGVAEIPAFGVSDALTISQPNFTLQNVQMNLIGGNVAYLTGATGPASSTA